MWRSFFITALMVAATASLLDAAEAPRSERPATAPPDYARHVAPLFRKYCLGCHNSQEAQGELILESHALAMKGGEHGAIVVAGNPDQSRLIQVLEKRAEPFMPPKDNQGPTSAEISVLRAWIRAGAKGSAETASIHRIETPRIEPTVKPRRPIAAIAFSPDGRWIATARYGCVDILSAADHQLVRTLSGHTGSVNDVGFSTDGSLLFAAAGETGVGGELVLWQTRDWSRRTTFRGHRDALLAAEISPGGKTIATASYDQTIRLWDVATGRTLRTFTGHNGPVFDVSFDPTGRLLASASGDRTVKLWDVATGERLDTFSQPTKDQYAVTFTPDGQFVVAGGVDSRIRVWRISASAKEGTNELVQSVFAHEGPIIRLAVSRDGRWIASSSEDRTIKVWDAARFVQVKKLAQQPDWTTALAISSDNRTLAAGRADGSLSFESLADLSTGSLTAAAPMDYAATPKQVAVAAKLSRRSEIEPNDLPANATPIEAPSIVDGVLSAKPAGEADADLFRFQAKRGETWMLETEAARKKSPADTRIDVLHADGSPVMRCLLRAVRDSAITFRPIDSQQNDARLENWQEMDLDQFLYLSGEVCRLFRAPRGPDSGFGMYTAHGARRCYFDTSAVSHALNEPVYIVEPYAPGTHLADNGLPVFPLYYSNDDEGSRALGSDSRVAFTAPADGTYLARITDVRGYGGPEFKYSLTIRPPQPDFHASVGPMNVTVPAGSGQKLSVNVDRLDDFEGEVRFDITGVPAGYHVSSPLVVQRGMNDAAGSIHADPTAKQLPKDAWKAVRVTATANISGRDVVKNLGGLGEVKLGPAPKIAVRMTPDAPAGAAQSSGKAPAEAAIPELVIEAGKSASAQLSIRRHGYDGELRFEVENLPHGVIVDNIGLSGIMIRAGETERQVFLTAEKWVPPTERLIHAVADREGKQTSLPVRLRVVSKTE